MGFPCLVNLEYSWALAVHLCLFVSATTFVLWLCLINIPFTIIFVCLVGPGSSYRVNWELGTSQSCLPLPGLGSSHRRSWELGDSQSCQLSLSLSESPLCLGPSLPLSIPVYCGFTTYTWSSRWSGPHLSLGQPRDWIPLWSLTTPLPSSPSYSPWSRNPWPYPEQACYRHVHVLAQHQMMMSGLMSMSLGILACISIQELTRKVMIVSVRVRKVRSTKTHGAIWLEATYFGIVVVLALPLEKSNLTSSHCWVYESVAKVFD